MAELRLTDPLKNVLGAATAKALAATPAKDAVIALADIELGKRDLPWRLHQAARTLADTADEPITWYAN